MFLYLVPALVSSVVAFSSAWYIQEKRLEAEIFSLKETHTFTINSIKEATVKNEKALRKTYEKALSDATKRQKELGEAVVASRDALGRLSDTADSALRNSRDSLDSCNATASTFRVVFDECTKQYDSLAAEAQGHFSDKQTLIESWPTLVK